MKIYLPTCLAISALAILATTASSMEKPSSLNQVSSDRDAISLNALRINNGSRLDGTKASNLSRARNEENFWLNLSPNISSLSLDESNRSRSDLTIKHNDFGQPGYSVTTSAIKF